MILRTDAMRNSYNSATCKVAADDLSNPFIRICIKAEWGK
jgi:hypothetical protein